MLGLVPGDLVVVLTCPRSTHYLADTLNSLERGGVRDVGATTVKRLLVVDDGTPPDLGADRLRDWPVMHLGAEPQGNLRAFLGVFEIAQKCDVDRLLFFEDDIVVCKNAVPKMLNTEVPDDCAFVSFFDMKELPYGTAAGMYKVSTMGKDGRGYWGSQAMLWPRRTIDYMLAHKDEILEGRNKHSSDCLFGHQLLYSPWPRYGVTVPNLADHTGIISAIWSWIPKVNRKATNFPGEGFDALSL